MKYLELGGTSHQEPAHQMHNPARHTNENRARAFSSFFSPRWLPSKDRPRLTRAKCVWLCWSAGSPVGSSAARHKQVESGQTTTEEGTRERGRGARDEASSRAGGATLRRKRASHNQ